MPTVIANNIKIAYEMHGSVGNPTLVLIQGLGMPCTAWPPPMIDLFVRSGFSVLVFDNRDVGHSQLIDARLRNLKMQFILSRLGFNVKTPYQLTDMMRDTDSLLDTLGIASAHVLGISMGGMIAQLLAIHNPERVKTLTSVMSTTGSRRLPGPTREVAFHMLSKPASDSDEDRMIHSIKTWRLIGSPAYPTPEDQLVAGLNRIFDRGVEPAGIARQLLAIMATPGRVESLRNVRIPTLVIHGDADPLVPLAAGIDTADAIPEARLEVIPGMGHDLPAQLLEPIVRLVATHVAAYDESLQLRRPA